MKPSVLAKIASQLNDTSAIAEAVESQLMQHDRPELLYTAPLDALEESVGEIWMKLLRVERVGRSDDFFLLGGHSLLATQMISRVWERYGVEIPLVEIFANTTLSSFSKVVRLAISGQPQEVKTVVPIRGSGSKPALFCVARPNVNTLGFLFLARALPQDVPVLGLQSTMENDGVLAPFTQLEYQEKAAEYIAAMREIQPRGPYFLTGFCEGAHIAFEMARQLKAMEMEVGILFILDVWPVENTVDRTRFMIFNYMRVLRRFIGKLKPDAHAIAAQQEYEATALNRKGPFIDRQLLKDPEARKLLNKRIMSRYWPGSDFQPTVYDGDVVIFRVAKQLFYRRPDEALGWRSRVTGKVDVVRVPGTHGLILREPAVSVVAAELGARIDAYAEQSAGVTMAPSR